MADIEQDLIPGKIGCRRLVAADEDAMLDLLTNHFVPREPICKVIEKSYPGQTAALLAIAGKGIIRDNGSLIAYDKKTGENVGMILGSLQHVGNEKVTPPENIISPVMRLFDALLQDISSYVGDSRYLVVAFSTVKEAYCRQGIMTNIRKRLELVANELNCGYIISESTSIYAQRLTENLGYSMKNEIKFVDHVDPVTGIRFMKDAEPPHYCIRLMVKKID
uniref:N-acetyltransferase domain-containing protein n=1 Tax=Ciona savignyi TaxID=51511 RepID=H2ZPK7_CIOSA